MRRLARDVLVMAASTGLSRVLGLFRDVAVANQFGASAAYDAFLIAFFVPHFLRQLLAEGALSTAFVPVYTELRVTGQDANRFAGNLLSLLMLFFPILVVAGILLAPVYVPFLASGFSPEKLTLTTTLARWLVPFIGLVGIAAVFMGILNAHHRFLAASLAPVWFNVGMIIGVLVLAGRLPGPAALGLAVGVLIGGFGQLISQIPALRRAGFRFRFCLRPIHPGVRVMLRRMAPAFLALAAAQVNLLVDNKIASYLDDGGISSLQYAMRLFQLPIGVFAVSIATALLPRFASSLARGERRIFSRYLSDGMLGSALVLLPATVALLIIGSDIIRWLFEHGSFDPGATARTARALSCYAIGLVPYGLVYLFTRAYYAIGRTSLPLVASVAGVIVNVVLDILLVGPMKEAGLALATAIAGSVNATILVAVLVRNVEWGRRQTRQASLILAGSGLVAIAVWAVRALSCCAHPAIAVIAPSGAGLLVYGAFVRLTGLWAIARTIDGAE